MARILLVDDEPSILNVLATLLRKQGHDTVASTGGEEARQLVRNETFDLMLTDIKMEPVNGLQLLEEMRAAHPETAVILLTGFASIKTAVAAMKGGAFDYITKPFKVDELLMTVERALEYHDILVENMGLRAKLEAHFGLENVVANSASMRKVCEVVERVAPSDATVLIIGESGTGKEVIARALHGRSRRKDGPFLTLNCAAFPEPLLEAELFGRAAGAPGGVAEPTAGVIETANGGTLLLDDIGAMPLMVQAKLLRFLQDKVFRKVGGNEELQADVRIIATNTEPLIGAVERKTFREDLYYRLNVIPITVPPLRQRRDDILPLVSHFLRRERPSGPLPALDPAAQRALLSYRWPGNVRELENAIRHALAYSRGDQIRKEDLPANVVDGAETSAAPVSLAELESYRGRSLKAFLRDREKEYVRMVIEKMGGDKQKAAQALRISLATLYRKLPEEET